MECVTSYAKSQPCSCRLAHAMAGRTGGAAMSYWDMAAVAASWTLASSSSVMQAYWVVPASVMATNWSGSMAAMLSKPEPRSAT